jgi:hypothetical protein
MNSYFPIRIIGFCHGIIINYYQTHHNIATSGVKMHDTKKDLKY